MRKLLHLCCFILATPSFAQEYSQIEGSVPSWEGQKILLQRFTNGDVKQTLDSTAVIGGRFQFRRVFGEPEAVLIKPERGRTLRVFISSAGSIRLREDAGKIDLNNQTGLENQMLFDQLMLALDSIAKVRFQLYGTYSELTRLNDKQGLTKISARFDSINAIQTRALKNFILNHHTSPVSIFAITLLTNEDSAVLREYLDRMPVDWMKYPSIKSIRYQIASEARTAIGQPAPEFSQQNFRGEMIRLSDFRGKYVLLDFWASWCGPCRKENPNLVTAFERYKNENFTILSVALERQGDRQKWLNAIAKDGVGEWTHVSDFRYFQNEVALLYGITAIPQNLLIDPTGRIIKKDVRGEQLQMTLKQLLDK